MKNKYRHSGIKYSWHYLKINNEILKYIDGRETDNHDEESVFEKFIVKINGVIYPEYNEKFNKAVQQELLWENLQQ